MKKITIPMIVIGVGLAALGLSGYGGNSIFTGWGDSARIEIAIGAALGVLGMILRKEGR
jgi:hypothetical protein